MWLRTRERPARDGARHPEPSEEVRGHLGPDGLVTVEMTVGQGGRLADVVEKRGEPDDRPVARRRIDRAEGVVEQVLAARLVLGDVALGAELRQHHVEQSGLGHESEPHRR
jgi:choline dehydrogenase-like flavoprotein